jgi:exodeoxyribonuclease V alpha subunit
VIPSTRTLLEAGRIGALDHYFADLMVRLCGEEAAAEDLKLLAAAAALVSAHAGEGYVSLALEVLAGQPVIEPDEEAAEDEEREAVDPALAEARWPELQAWTTALRRCRVVGEGDETTPLVLDDQGVLWLHRFWEHERGLEGLLRARYDAPADPVDAAWLGAALDRLFPAEPGDLPDSGEPDWRKLAGLVVATRRFAVVSGGPGTGKTTAVIKLLALLIEQAQAAGRALRIALVAPTGKAAARLQETVDAQRDGLPVSEAVREALPREASTIHRRLGAYGSGFVYSADNRLPYDVVVVDESSMVDLALMSRLVAALPDRARLILLGDRDQLASVAPGAVLGDLCREARERGYSRDLARRFEAVTGAKLPADELRSSPTGLGDCVVQLRRNFRFDANSGIGALARHAVAGDWDKMLEVLRDPSQPSVGLVEPSGPGQIPALVAQAAVDNYAAYLRAPTVEVAFEAFGEYRILCALRRGKEGVEHLNRVIEARLAREGLCDGRSEWYRGRPVMVTRNDHALRLYNGDVGLCWPSDEGVLLVWFPDGKGGFRTFQPTRLPEHETVYAMTVHKSQGSEFGRVLLVLPEAPSKVVTRELVYTGVTRGRVEVVMLRFHRLQE